MEIVSVTFGVEARTFAVMFANVVAGRASFPRFSRKRRGRNYVFQERRGKLGMGTAQVTNALARSFLRLYDRNRSFVETDVF